MAYNDVFTSLGVVVYKIDAGYLGKQLTLVEYQGLFDISGHEKELRSCCLLLGYQ